MEHTFTVSRADHLALRKQMVVQLRKRRPGAPWLFLLFVTGWLFAGAAVASFLRAYGRSGSLQDALSLLAALIVATLVAFFIWHAVASRVVEKHLLRDAGGFLAPQTLTCEDGGIRLTTQTTGASVWLPWGAFMGRAEDARNLYLFTEPSYGVILPKAALSEACSTVLRARIVEL